jgi:hypothetical protein
VLVRLVEELDRLDAVEDLDPAVRARAVARLCAVALAVHKQAGPFGVGERDPQVLRARLAELALLARAAVEAG